MTFIDIQKNTVSEIEWPIIKKVRKNPQKTNILSKNFIKKHSISKETESKKLVFVSLFVLDGNVRKFLQF